VYISLWFLASPQPPYLVLSPCVNSTNIGFHCTFSGALCDVMHPCKNNGTCNNSNDNQNYNCSCLPGFNGTQCEFDHRPCKEDTCWNNGKISPFFYLLE
jgi:hypothetical protein